MYVVVGSTCVIHAILQKGEKRKMNKIEVKAALVAEGKTENEADTLITDRETLYKQTTIREILAKLENTEGEDK